MFTQYAERYGGSSAAAHELLAAELARQALGPNRTLSPNSAVPVSFDEIRQRYSGYADEPRLAPDLDRAASAEIWIEGNSIGWRHRHPLAARSTTRRLLDEARSGIRRRRSASKGQAVQGTTFDEERAPQLSGDRTLKFRANLCSREPLDKRPRMPATF